MKNSYAFLLIILFLSSVSCSKDESPEENETAALTGEWQLEEFQYQGTTQVKNGSILDESSYIGTAKDIDVYMLFNDNTWESGGEYTIELVTTVNGEVQTTMVPYSDFLNTGSYTQKEDVLSIGYDQNEGALAISEGTITKLTEHELILEFDFSETTVISGFEVELQVDGFQRFSR